MNAVRSVRGLDAGQSAALIISESQRGVLDPDLAIFPGLANECATHDVLARIALLAEVFRENNLPVIHVHVSHRANFVAFAGKNPVSGLVMKHNRMLHGSDDVEAMPAVAPKSGDIISLRHSGVGMWYGTDLDATLRNLAIDTIVFSGVSTNLAIAIGAAGAADRGFAGVIATDATAGATHESHEWMLTNMLPLLATIATSNEIADAIGRGGADAATHNTTRDHQR